MANWRRWTEERVATVYTAAVLFGTGVVLLGPALVGARTLISVNALSAYFPWRADGLATNGHIRCTGDTIDTVMPSIHYVREQWFSGHLGAWQSLLAGGGPVGVLPNLGLLDPLSLPYFVLPLWLAPAFVKLLELLVGGGATYLFLRRFDVSRPASMIAGLVFGTSGFMVVWSNWPQTRVAALIPALFWAIERLLQRLRLSDAALLAVVVASLVLGGFPAVTGWALEVAGVYFLVRLWVLHRDDLRTVGRGLGLAVSGLVVGGLLTMVELLPFAKVYRETNVDVRSNYGMVPLPTNHLVTLVDPNAYGLCVGGEPIYDHTSPVENVAYLGAAAVLLALIGACVRRRRSVADGSERRVFPGRGVTMFFALATAVILAVGWSSSTILRHLQFLPPFSGNPVGRIRAVLGFTAAVLVGFGADAVLRHRRRSDALRPERTWIRPVLFTALFAIASAVVLVKVHSAAVQQGIWPVVKPTLYVPALLALATLVVLALAATGRTWGRWVAIVAIPLLVAGQGGFFFHRWLPGDDPADFYPRTDVHQYLSSNLGHERFDTSGMVMYPSTALYYDLRTATGHTPQAPQWLDLLHAVDPAVALTPTFTAFSSGSTPQLVGSSAILDRLGVRYWVFDPGTVTGTAIGAPGSTGTTTLTADGAVTCLLPGGPVRGVTVRLASPLSPASATRPATITVTTVNGDHTVSSARSIPNPVPAGNDVTIGVPGEDFGTGQSTVHLSLRGAAGPVRVQSSGAQASCGLVRPAADGLKLVQADAGAVVYERLSALPRIRWSGSSTVVTDPTAQVQALAHGVPRNTVLLGAPAGTSSGKDAHVTVTRDVGGLVSATVDAAGAGYVTLADSLTRKGWSVTVDGRRASLLVADHALGAVAVPAGHHQISFRYSPPGLRAGLGLTVVGLVSLAGLLIGDAVLRRRRRTALPQQTNREPSGDD